MTDNSFLIGITSAGHSTRRSCISELGQITNLDLFASTVFVIDRAEYLGFNFAVIDVGGGALYLSGPDSR